MNIKTTLKTSVAAAALFAMAAPMATPTAEAGNVTSGKKNSLSMSGYVTKSLMYADDGNSEQLFMIDGGTSESRIRWVAKGTVNENVSAGAFIELEIPLSNVHSGASLGNTVGATDATTTTRSSWAIRHQFVWVFHKKFGKLSLGQTNAANNGGAEASLSGTTGIDLSGGNAWGLGVAFIEDTNSTLSTTTFTVGNVFNNFDATSRTDVLRYDTPKFQGLGLAASLNGAGGGEFGAKFSRKFGPVKVLAKGGYSGTSSTSTTVEGIWSVSGAVLHDSGLNASLSFSGRELKNPAAGRDDPENFFASIGYKAKLFGAGGTNFNLIYANNDDLGANGDDAEARGVTALQNFDSIGAWVALSYRNYEFDQPGKSYDEIDVITFTTLFNF